MNMTETPAAVSTDERKEALAREVASQVRKGWGVEAQSDYQAVLVKGRHVRHILHAILTLLTVGLWLVVWVPIWLVYRQRRRVLAVDAAGNVTG